MADKKYLDGDGVAQVWAAVKQHVADEGENKADIDGYYSQLTAGLAENLIGRGDAVPAEYLYRTAVGTADIEDGIATVDCIKGNTLVWNQRVRLVSRTATSNGITYTAQDGKATFSAPNGAEGLETFYTDISNRYTPVAGHKYIAYGTSPDGSVRLSHQYMGILPYNQVFTTTATQAAELYFSVLSTFTGTYECYPMLFDLTLMFGAGNEPATVAEFEAMYPLPYYLYSAPKLLPVDMRGIETVGFNAYNPSTGEAELLGGHQYQISGTYTSLSYSTGESIALDSDGIFTPSENGTLTVTGGNATDTCVHLVWSGYRNGEYEEYWSAERPIDTSRFFPTGMKKAGDKADALYSDHYDTVIGSVDLGTLTWTAATANRFRAALPDAKTPANDNTAANLKCAHYAILTANQTASGNEGIAVTVSGNVAVYDAEYAGGTAADFKASLSGVILYYELATPTTTEIDPPLNLSYKVSDFGTERIMVDETADAPQTAPVPMEVEYGLNAIDTIRRLPTEYQSHKSMGQFETALASSLGIDITETWDETEQRYEYEVSDFEPADDTFACIAAPDGPTATANHAVGTYLIMGRKLYKVTTAIAAGDTIAAGTNVTQTTVMDELIALTA